MLHRFEPSVSHLRSFKRGVRYKPYSAYFTFDAYHITVIIESVSLAESFFAHFINFIFFGVTMNSHRKVTFPGYLPS